jgi:hypothetical protein
MAAKKNSTRKGKTERETVRTPENRIKILMHVADGLSLRRISRMEGMPDRSVITKWLAEDPNFAAQYARAWAMSADADFEDIYDIADDGTNDWNEVYDRDGNFIGWKENREAINRSRLRVDVRKWAASKKQPKKYGHKPDLTTPVDFDSIDIENSSVDEMRTAFESLIRN